LPGVLFVTILGKFTTYSFTISDLIVGAFVCYFIGLVINRFGSLVIEPILKKISFLHFANYPDFVSASKKDSKIEIFSETNNMYRTLSAMLILFALLKIYELIELGLPAIKAWNPYILIVLLIIMLLYSYRKQTEYIRKRIEANK
jgi:hypothetical protein